MCGINVVGEGGNVPPPLVFGAQKSLVGIELGKGFIADYDSNVICASVQFLSSFFHSFFLFLFYLQKRLWSM